MPDDSSIGSGSDGGYDNSGGFGSNGGMMGGGSYGDFSQVDAATVAAALGAVSMTAVGMNNPGVASLGMIGGGALMSSGALSQALSDMNTANVGVGPGTSGLGGLDIGNMAAGIDIAAAVSDGHGTTDYFNSAGQLVGSTFNQMEYVAWAYPPQSSSDG